LHVFGPAAKLTRQWEIKSTGEEMKKVISGILLVAATAVTVCAQAETVAGALANPARMASDIARDERSRPAAVLALLDIKAGDRVADIFAGGGYYSEIIGQVVSPGGEVLMHNNKAYLSFVSEALTKRFEGRELPGVQRHDREIDNLDLGEGSLDAAMIIMSYHDLYHTADGWPAIDRADFMGQIVRALKPGGRFLIVDHNAAVGTGKDSAQELHRIEESFARQDVESYGLKYARSSDALRNSADDYTAVVFAPGVRGKTDRFVLVFEKPK
jgi:predicted methyltransferase